jgi:hypothetical protein
MQFLSFDLTGPWVGKIKQRYFQKAFVCLPEARKGQLAGKHVWLQDVLLCFVSS